MYKFDFFEVLVLVDDLRGKINLIKKIFFDLLFVMYLNVLEYSICI